MSLQIECNPLQVSQLDQAFPSPRAHDPLIASIAGLSERINPLHPSAFQLGAPSQQLESANAEAAFAAASPIVDLKTIQADVIHLGQMHWVPAADNDPALARQILAFQIQIAEYLLSNSIKEVFAEGITMTLGNSASESNHFRRARSCFPNGVPSNFNSLNGIQKKFLIRYGAENTLYYLGEIKTVYRTISPEKLAELEKARGVEYAKGHKDRRCDPMRSLIYDERERALLEEIREWMPNSEGKRIVITYGFCHNFEKYFNSEKFTYVNKADSNLLRLDVLNQKLLKHPDNMRARLNRISILLKDHRYAEALADYQYLLDLYNGYGMPQEAQQTQMDIDYINHLYASNLTS